MPQLSNLKYSCSYRNAPIYWGFSAHPSMEKSGRRIWVAEGEELGSNLLRVTERSLWGSGGLPEATRSPSPTHPRVTPGDALGSPHGRQYRPPPGYTPPGNTFRHPAMPVPSLLTCRIDEPGSDWALGSK